MIHVEHSFTSRKHKSTLVFENLSEADRWSNSNRAGHTFVETCFVFGGAVFRTMEMKRVNENGTGIHTNVENLNS